MSLTKRLFLIGIVDFILVGSTYYYFWIKNKDVYFPDRYEAAFSCLGSTILFCLGTTIVLIVHHHYVRKKKAK